MTHLHKVTKININLIMSVKQITVQSIRHLQRLAGMIRLRAVQSHSILVYTKAMGKSARIFQKSCVRDET